MEDEDTRHLNGIMGAMGMKFAHLQYVMIEPHSSFTSRLDCAHFPSRDMSESAALKVVLAVAFTCCAIIVQQHDIYFNQDNISTTTTSNRDLIHDDMSKSRGVRVAATLPPILYGTAWKKEKTRDLVVMALKSGFRGIDTACQPRHYHEVGVGQALKIVEKQDLVHREQIYIQTVCEFE